MLPFFSYSVLLYICREWLDYKGRTVCNLPLSHLLYRLLCFLDSVCREWSDGHIPLIHLYTSLFSWQCMQGVIILNVWTYTSYSLLYFLVFLTVYAGSDQINQMDSIHLTSYSLIYFLVFLTVYAGSDQTKQMDIYLLFTHILPCFLDSVCREWSD